MLNKGIYENVIDVETANEIEEAEAHGLACRKEEADEAETPSILADYLAKVIRAKLKDIEEVSDRVKEINRILLNCGIEGKIVDDRNLLMEVMTRQQEVLQNESGSRTVRPFSGFRVSNLFTGGSSTLSLNEEIRRDIATANRISLIVSFLKMSGMLLLLDDLKRFCERGGKLRIITTTYCGATDAKAVQQLAELPNTEIKISYNTKVERLHAKSYIFERDSGMHTAYIGSSNLSKSAHTDGLEWNIRVTNEENPHIIKTALATFDIYWNSTNFEDYKDGDIEKLREELGQNRNHGESEQLIYQQFSLLPHQKQILDKLKVEREELHNYKNLIVAATGTGKTVISAFDYSAFRNNRKGGTSKLLYVAHRQEILKQSLATFRSVLRDENFGTLWVGNYAPEAEKDYEHLFLSVSMFKSRFNEFFNKMARDYYDYIVIDEAHHSRADSYRELFSQFEPKLLIGLTATPERMDGQDLRPDFGGHISAEIRLPQALQAGLLTPFQYLCVTDNTNLSDDSLWNGRYLSEKLADRLCDETRSATIVNALRRYIANEHECRALCFCVNVRHAEFMAEQLSKYGLKAKSLTSNTSDDLRVQYASSLRAGELNYLCVVDVFNEGVDLPEVDTVLFLRPTDSLTIFLQQLGRGLRLYPEKTELTVLDFVAQVHAKYDYASRFRALSLRPEKNVKEQVENGFTYLPTGCSIVMERVARQHILDNIQGAIYNSRRLTNEIQNFDPSSEEIHLKDFLESIGQYIRIIYRNGHCWTSLKRAALRVKYDDDNVTARLQNGISGLIHHKVLSFLHFVSEFIKGGPDYSISEENKPYATLLFTILFNINSNRELESLGNIYNLNMIHDEKYKPFKEEIAEVVDYLIENLEITTTPLGKDILPGIELYGCYSQNDIFILAEGKLRNVQQGVHRMAGTDTYLLFVTLNKSDKDFSPTTQYEDYVIDEKHFHWQSQNRDTHANKSGQVYSLQRQNHNKIVLFVREDKRDSMGTSPYHCFGLVNCLESWGDAPMNVKWELEQPIMARYLKVV